MTTALSCARSSRDESSSFRVWMSAAASPAFALWRLVVMSLSVSALGAACLTASCPYLLPAALFFGTWPLPFRCRIGRGVLEVSWLFVRYEVPLEAIDGWGLVLDPRRWVLGRRRLVLRISRWGQPPLLLFASSSVLRALAAELRCRLRGSEASS